MLPISELYISTEENKLGTAVFTGSPLLCNSVLPLFFLLFSHPTSDTVGQVLTRHTAGNLSKRNLKAHPPVKHFL